MSTPYDRRLCARTLALSSLLGLLVVLIVAATDEQGSRWPARAARVCALLPVVGGFAAFLASEQARARGELRAHAALGVPSLQATSGSWFGGSLMGAAGAVWLLSGRVDLQSLFPRAVAFQDVWSRHAGGWFEASRGILIDAGGQLSWAPPAGGPLVVAEGTIARAATFCAVLVAALAFPLWGAARASVLRRATVGLAVAGASIAVFHLVAAGRTWDGLLVLPPALLLIDAVRLHRAPSWS